MLIGEVRYRPGEMRIPLGPVFALQECVGAFQRRHLRQTQVLHQTILGGEKAAFKLGYEAEPKLVYLVPVIHKLPEDNARQGFLEPEQYEKMLEQLLRRRKLVRELIVSAWKSVRQPFPNWK